MVYKDFSILSKLEARQRKPPLHFFMSLFSQSAGTVGERGEKQKHFHQITIDAKSRRERAARLCSARGKLLPPAFFGIHSIIGGGREDLNLHEPIRYMALHHVPNFISKEFFNYDE